MNSDVPETSSSQHGESALASWQSTWEGLTPNQKLLAVLIGIPASCIILPLALWYGVYRLISKIPNKKVRYAAWAGVGLVVLMAMFNSGSKNKNRHELIDASSADEVSEQSDEIDLFRPDGEHTLSNDEMLRKLVEMTAIMITAGDAQEGAGVNKLKKQSTKQKAEGIIERWKRTTPGLFNTYLRATAKACGAGQYAHSRHLLTITPSDTRESLDDDGFKTLLVQYGEESAAVIIGFMQAPNEHAFSLVKVRFGGDSISPYEAAAK